jgi:hypothetical protein
MHYPSGLPLGAEPWLWLPVTLTFSLMAFGGPFVLPSGTCQRLPAPLLPLLHPLPQTARESVLPEEKRRTNPQIDGYTYIHRDVQCIKPPLA